MYRGRAPDRDITTRYKHTRTRLSAGVGDSVYTYHQVAGLISPLSSAAHARTRLSLAELGHVSARARSSASSYTSSLRMSVLAFSA